MSSTQGISLQIPDLTNTFGALFIGVVFAAVLFGITNVQAFIYFRTHKDTGMTLYKLIVIWFWVLDTLHLFLIVHCVYSYLVTNFGNVNILAKILWCFKVQVIVDVCIIFTVFGLYAHRIWIVSNGRSRVIAAMMGIFLVIGSGVSIALIWAVYKCQEFQDLDRFGWAVYMALTLIAFVDIVIASSLCYLLAKSRTGFSRTDSLITRLITYIVNTGCLTSIASIAAMITFAVMPRNFIFISIEFVIAQLYVNSYLALLNARYYLQPGDSDTLGSSAFRIHPFSRHSRGSTTEQFQDSARSVFKRSYDHVERPNSQRPIAVKVEVNSFSSV